MLHPAIKLFSVILISIFIGLTGWWGFLFSLVLIISSYQLNINLYQRAFLMLFRMKWLLISIVILYGLFIPYENLDLFSHQALILFSPLLHRIGILMVIIFAVNFLINTNSKDEIIASVYLLIKPLEKLGLNLNSFLMSTYLSMDFVGKLNKEISTNNWHIKNITIKLSQWLDKQVNQDISSIEIKLLDKPVLQQWLIPFLITLSYGLITLI